MSVKATPDRLKTEIEKAKELLAEEKPVHITPEEAQRIVEAERARNLRACEAEIQTVLQRWGCRLVAVPYLEDGLTRATVQIRVA